MNVPFRHGKAYFNDRRWVVGRECPTCLLGSENSTSISGSVTDIGLYSISVATGLSSAGMMSLALVSLRDRAAASNVIAEPAVGVLLDALP